MNVYGLKTFYCRITICHLNMYRHYDGEDLEQLNLRELQNVEQQLETALKRIRTKKNQLMHESISELHKKERALQERNNSLSKKLKENEKTSEQQIPMLHLPQHPPQPYPCSVPSFANTSGPFIGAAMREEESVQVQPVSTTMMPLWMIRHINQ
uniref:K-box domain-containing protein n=1 Tax=Lactuca sativa TaxID=4236 RepID=A0A9R1WF56_LACSA|nr:hypothetical protein LSAT_V11C200082270 [Lactuca sativa]